MEKRDYAPIRPLTEAERQTVLDNMGLVYQAVRKAAWAMVMRRNDHNDPRILYQQYFNELFDAGCIGLCIAVQWFDPLEGNKFSTMAFQWIRQHVNKAEQLAAIRTCKSILFNRRRVKLFSEMHTGDSGGNGSRQYEVWDERPTEKPEENPTLPADLLNLMSLVLDERGMRFIVQHVLEGRQGESIAEEEGISKQRVFQIIEHRLAALRMNEAFMHALEKQRERKRTELRFADFADGKIARFIA